MRIICLKAAMNMGSAYRVDNTLRKQEVRTLLRPSGRDEDRKNGKRGQRD